MFYFALFAHFKYRRNTESERERTNKTEITFFYKLWEYGNELREKRKTFKKYQISITRYARIT
jgi:hypothetical protein